MSDANADKSKRRFLTQLTVGLGVVGTAFVATPFVLSMTPSARTLAAGAPVDVDISKIEPGQMLTVAWRGKPVWIVRRTPEMLQSLQTDRSLLVDPDSNVSSQQPAYAKNATRSIKPDILVLVGLCTHLGCAPVPKFDVGPDSGLGDNWPGGWFCPCHGSRFDLAGRVMRGSPAPTNLVVPPYAFINDTHIKIGIDPKGAA